MKIKPASPGRRQPIKWHFTILTPPWSPAIIGIPIRTLLALIYAKMQAPSIGLAACHTDLLVGKC